MTCENCDDKGHIEVICIICDGSGEGKHDGSVCHVCKGKGEVFEMCDECEEKINDD